MTRITTIIIFLSLFWNPVLLAQKTGLMASAGAGSFRMDDMKYLQEQILTNYPVKGRIISSFPSYFTYSIGIVRKPYPYIKLGGGYELTSTGGKSNYTDYSGSISTNFRAILHRLGLFISYSLIAPEPFEISVYGRVDLNFSRLGISSDLYVTNYFQRSDDKYRSFSPAPSAGLDFYYHLPSFSVGLDAGYLVDIAGDLYHRETGRELIDPLDNTRILTTDWTGWRARLKLIYWIRK